MVKWEHPPLKHFMSKQRELYNVTSLRMRSLQDENWSASGRHSDISPTKQQNR